MLSIDIVIHYNDYIQHIICVFIYVSMYLYLIVITILLKILNNKYLLTGFDKLYQYYNGVTVYINEYKYETLRFKI